MFNILIDLKPDRSSEISANKETAKNVLKYLEKLWEEEVLSDVTFKCGDNSIKAHTLILASGSPVLAAMLQNDLSGENGLD